MTIYSTKVGNLLRVVSLVLCLGCVNLDQPKSVKDCLANGGCSDQTIDDAAGVSNNASEVGSDAVGKADLVLTGNDDVSPGSGGITGAGGVMSLDGAPDTSGAARGGSPGTGGGLGGSAALDAAIGADSATGSGGKSTNTDGALGSGGAVSLDGAIGSGGKTSLDGPLGTGGHSGTGGTSGTGGATVSACGTAAASTVSQTFSFASDLEALSIDTTSSASGSQLKHVTAGPTANPTLCTSVSGCAALSLTFASGTAAYKAFALAIESYAPSVNLVGSTVTFSLAVDNPGTTVPIQIQAYAQGDKSANYAWTQPTTVGGANLLAYEAETQFTDLTLHVTDYTSATGGQYCSAVTGAIGIQLQNTDAITASNAGTVTIYISKITITPP
jgi:hypothetical protein